MSSVFISWSGTRSQGPAVALREWLNSVIQRLSVFVSAQDLAAGVKWSEEVVDALRDATYGIVCVTSDNFDKPWLNFESGAIANAVGRPRVAPVLLDLSPAEVVGPLSLFQMVSVERDGIFRLVTSINDSLGPEAVLPPILERSFQLAWPDFEKTVGQLKRLPASTMIAEKLQNAIVVFTREPDPDIRDFLASTGAQHSVGLAWTDGPRFYSDARARRVAPWLHDGNWSPERKRANG
ncbi:MAG: hypothetical protein JWM87_917 [Candidatus Eremiobacteraeota bacterium]|nr:hypothetical protein [Candidatus Eremiobacteraeota bacterium]